MHFIDSKTFIFGFCYVNLFIFGIKQTQSTQVEIMFHLISFFYSHFSHLVSVFSIFVQTLSSSLS